MRITDQKFDISTEILDKCRKFGADSVNSSLDKYAFRHGFDVNDPDAVERAVSKFSKDITIGKIGEEFVYRKYIQFIHNLKSPDYNIYSINDKSWEPDLKDLSSNLSIAVKSQDIRSRLDNGESWVFQLGSSGKDTDKEIFNELNEDSYVAFVSLNIPKRIGEIKAVVKLSWLHKNKLFKPMQIDRLQSNKIAVYFSDLEVFVNELWQL